MNEEGKNELFQAVGTGLPGSEPAIMTELDQAGEMASTIDAVMYKKLAARRISLLSSRAVSAIRHELPPPVLAYNTCIWS